MERKILNAYIQTLYELHSGARVGGDYLQGKLDALGKLGNFTWGRKMAVSEEARTANGGGYEVWIYSVYDRDTEEFITARNYPYPPSKIEIKRG